MRVFLADDHGLFREGLRAILEREGLSVVGEAGTGREAVGLVRELHPDIIVMDLSMPDLNGVEATRQLLATQPGAKVIGLSMASDRRQVLAMLTAGASGYLLKTSAIDELLRAVHDVAAGRKYVSPAVTNILLEYLAASKLRDSRAEAPASADTARELTPREREVLQLIAEGASSKEVAVKLGIAVGTVETHRRQIADKLGLRTVAELTKYAIRSGITSVD